MNGVNPAFSQPSGSNPTLAPPTYTLPQNYGFNELANYESTLRGKFGDTASADILKTRDSLAQSLNDQGKQFFDQQNPAILEDLNSRGLLTSQSEVANKTARALKEIELNNQSYLRDFDTSALNARLQAQQDALDSGLDLRRGGLGQAGANAAADKEQALANSLADKNARNQLTGSLIGAGGSLLGAALPSLLAKGAGAGAARALAGGGTAAATGAGAGGIPLAGAGGAGTAGAGTAAGGIGLGGAAGIAGAGVGAALLARAAEKKAGGGTLGKVAGTIANPIGQQINEVKNIVSKAFGAGKTGVNVGNQQAQMNDLFSQANEVKGLMDSGQVDPEDAQAALDELNRQAITLYHQTAGQGSKAANNIRNNFNQFVTGGFLNQTGNDSYTSNFGNKFSSTML
jgi:polyhydroxyalkanoate synthesis regulator phasin